MIAQLALAFGKVACGGRTIVKMPGHLDELEARDYAFIAFGKVGVCVLTYHLLRYCWYAQHVQWAHGTPCELADLRGMSS